MSLSDQFIDSFRAAIDELRRTQAHDSFGRDLRLQTGLMISDFKLEANLNDDIEKVGIIPYAAKIWCEKQIGKLYSFHKEWYTIDFLAVTPPVKKRGYDFLRSDCELIIEHENLYDVETEIWKFVHWRSKLKVLVFYDFALESMSNSHSVTDPVIGRVTCNKWLLEKTAELANIINRNHQALGPDFAEYLIIVGQPNSSGECYWRSSKFEQGKFGNLVPI